MSIQPSKAVRDWRGYYCRGILRSARWQDRKATSNKSRPPTSTACSNRAGGLERHHHGEDVIVRATSAHLPLRSRPRTADMVPKNRAMPPTRRSDWCVFRGRVIGEAMGTLVLAVLFWQKFGGDSLLEMKRISITIPDKSTSSEVTQAAAPEPVFRGAQDLSHCQYGDPSSRNSTSP